MSRRHPFSLLLFPPRHTPSRTAPCIKDNRFTEHIDPFPPPLSLALCPLLRCLPFFFSPFSPRLISPPHSFLFHQFSLRPCFQCRRRPSARTFFSVFLWTFFPPDPLKWQVFSPALFPHTFFSRRPPFGRGIFPQASNPPPPFARSFFPSSLLLVQLRRLQRNVSFSHTVLLFFPVFRSSLS